MKKALLLAAILINFSISYAQEPGHGGYFIPDSLITYDNNGIEAGSCASPDGAMNVIGTPPSGYAWLQTNGYCNPGSYGNTGTVCWTFTLTLPDVDINSGWSGSGCVNYAFGPFNLYTCAPACTFIGSGLSFTGLTPGQCYTFCMGYDSWGGGPGCTGFDDFCPYYIESGVMPVEYLSFTGESTGNKNTLKWATASETGNDYFTLERSMDGSDFEAISTVNGAGSSTTINNYEAVDNNPVKGNNYYRLKQTDYDGKFEYTTTIAIKCFKDDQLIINGIYPNPNSGEFVIEMELAKPLEMEIQLLNVIGQAVYKEDMGRVSGAYQKQLDLKALAKGIYTLQLTSEEGTYTRKLMIE